MARPWRREISTATRSNDLAVGVPGEGSNGQDPATGRGAVHIVFGTAIGLSLSGNLLRTESDLGGQSQIGALFGRAVAAGDFDGDLRDDLAIGAPFRNLGAGGTIPDAGHALVLYGGGFDFDFGRTQTWSQDSVSGAGTSEADDRFGFALTAGDFDRDGREDLAVGHPGEFNLVPADGLVTVLMGTSTGISAERHRGFTRGFDGCPGPINEGSRFFGQTLATGDFDGDGHADLIAGAPFADEAGLANVGDEIVLYGSLFSDGFETSTAGLWSSLVP